MLLCNLTSN